METRNRLETRVIKESTPDLSLFIILVRTETGGLNSRVDPFCHMEHWQRFKFAFDLNSILCFFTTIPDLELSFFIDMLDVT